MIPLNCLSVKEELQTTFLRAREAAARLLGKRRRRRSASPESSPRARVFDDGEFIASRYRVVQFLEHGGAGQVYEVEDLELGGRVALKTLHRRVAASQEALEQFKQEISLARTVTHDSVCRLFDFGRHPAEDGGEDRLFVTMELLAGETLSDLLERNGPLDLHEIVPLATQITDGLAAAHRQGIIHRDIKGSNVMLVPRADSATRAVVTDFGLALGTSAAEPGAEMPSPPRFEGTPLFMAPEQVRGDPVSPATDVYACGILFFHMLTGRWPFTGESPVSTALLRIEQEPTPPSRFRSHLDPRCERLIMRCLERDPARRFASAVELGEALTELENPQQPRPTVLKIAWRWLIPLAATLALGIAGGLWLARAPEPFGAARSTVVVLGFDNATARPELDWVGTLMAQSIASGLAAGERLRAIDGAESALRADLAITGSTDLDPDDSKRLRRRTGADFALMGTYRQSQSERSRGDSLDLTLKLQRLGVRHSPATLELSGRLDELSALSTRAVQDLRSELQLPGLSDQQQRRGRAELPEHPEAAQRYAEGLAALQRFDARSAREALEAALEHEPHHPMILMRLAEAWFELGHSSQSQEIGEQALDASGELSREKQLAIEARYRVLTHDWQRAEELYRALREFFPNDLEYGLALADAQDRGSRLEEASATLASLRELPDPWGADPRIDLAESMVAYHGGDYPRSRAAAARAVEVGRQLGARSLIATGLSREVLTSVATDEDTAGTLERLIEARDLYTEIGNQRGLVSVLLTLGSHASRRGDLSEAESYYRPALEIATAIGDAPGLARGKTSLAILLDQRGRLSEGLALKEDVLANYRSRSVAQGAAITLENLGISLLKMGRLEEALTRLLEAAGQFEELGDQIGLAWSPYYQGRVWLDYGELGLARNRLEDARQAAVTHPAGGLAQYVAFELIRIALARGELVTAESQALELIDEFERLEQGRDATESRLLLSRVVMAQGEAHRATELAEAALASFEADRRSDLVAAALVVMATAKPSEETCDRLAQRLNDLEHGRVALRGRVALARCTLEADRAAKAEISQQLDAIITEAKELGLFEPRLEAERLRLEIVDTAPEERAALVASLRREAEDLGWAWRSVEGEAIVLASTGDAP
ncbi:MAG: protein kinase [Acidobacteriota bacterium]